MAPAQSLRPGSVFAGYRIEGLVGAGGMGSVYSAHHPRLPRMVALKLLHPSFAADPVFRGRFEREAQLAGRLDHPNIVAIHDRGQEGEQLWIAMQYIQGGDADSLARGGPLPPARALHIARETANALDHAHAAGLLHRDVKPANILLRAPSAPGAPEQVLLTDFGIAKSADEVGSLTQTGTLLATLRYAAPEQLSGGELGPRTDQYSLACTLFHLLAGRPPFTADTAAGVIGAHLMQPVPRISTLRPDLPPALDAVFERAMAKNPEHRFPSCAAMAAAASAAFDPPRAPLPPTPPPSRKRRWLLALGAVAAVLAVAGAGAFALRPDETPTTTTTSTPPPTTSTAPDPWAAGRDTVALFPDLLPAGPDTVGYRDLRCSFATKNPGAVWEHGFNCTDRQGLELQVLQHDSAATVDRYVATLEQGATETLTSRYGEPLTVRKFNGSTGPWILVRFGAAPRSSVLLQVFEKGSSHQEVIDEWLRSAPL
ncbi:serine/threonine-protein kinase [Nocardia puris]|uniref:serine/threonine-protein kinase n=1 Tax=Nocardia puris TaxID=208602 RepID=UPI001F171247|nr:serine/threonine-protein kinase [Nocardia puris]